MKHVMIDLETWATTPNAELRSIGAVEFFPGKVETFSEILDRAFYVNVEDYPAGDRKRFVRSAATAEWWDSQGEEAKDAFEYPAPMYWGAAMLEMISYLKATMGDDSQQTLLWCKGPAFDIAILEYHLAHTVVEMPIRFTNYRDTRTIMHLFVRKFYGELSGYPLDFIPHRADHDAAMQALHLGQAMRAMGVAE